MSRCGKRVNLPSNYNGFLLVFNEPNNPEPFGCDITPQEAVARFQRLRKALPQAKMVIGGVSIWAIEWLKSFLEEYKLSGGEVPDIEALAVHAYIEEWITVDIVRAFMLKTRSFTSLPVWVTEMGSCDGLPETMDSLITMISGLKWVERYAAYTNRQSGHESWAICDGVVLFSWDGYLTPAGRAYRGGHTLDALHPSDLLCEAVDPSLSGPRDNQMEYHVQC